MAVSWFSYKDNQNMLKKPKKVIWNIVTLILLFGATFYNLHYVINFIITFLHHANQIPNEEICYALICKPYLIYDSIRQETVIVKSILKK